MDWTGGSRRRFAAGKGNATLRKQKEHFAKARASQNSRGSQRTIGSMFPPRGQAANSRRQREPIRSGRFSDARSAHESPRASDRQHGHRNRDTARPDLSTVPCESEGSHSRSPREVISQHTRRVMHHHQRSDHVVPIDANEEERLLYAKRRKLLSRTDWLGLAPLKAIPMRFPENTDHIGKRRKVASTTSRKGKPAAPHPIAPLFHKPPPDNEYMMSGALRPSEVEIKIGTDALASQMHPSQRSPAAGGATGRLASTDLASMSEEPMLLDGNENDFDFARITDPVQGVLAEAASDHGAGFTMLSNQQHQQAHYTSDSPLARMGNTTPEHHVLMEQLGNVLVEHPQELATEDLDAKGPADLLPHGKSYLVHSPVADADLQLHEGLGKGYSSSERGIDQFHPDHQRSSPAKVEERRWQYCFNIAQESVAPRSIAVQRSSMNTSSSDARSHRVIPPQVEQGDSRHDRCVDPSMRGYQQVSNGLISSNEAPAISESASLKQIERLAAAPAPHPRPGHDEVKYDALWRRFIIGSDDGCDEESEHFGDTPVRGEKDDEFLEAARASPTLAISGLGTSAESTMGDTLFMNDSASSAEQVAAVHPQSEPDLRTESSNPASDVNAVSEAAGTLGSDEIEDVRWPEDRVTVPTNMHAISTSRLDPRRFKPPPKKQKYQQRANARHRKVSKPVRREYSVYDLVDSDGNSLPG